MAEIIEDLEKIRAACSAKAEHAARRQYLRRDMRGSVAYPEWDIRKLSLLG